MSELAESCEYLTVEKICQAVAESAKAQANRLMKCQNDEKETCCYLCQSRLTCQISCKYLGELKPASTYREEPKRTYVKQAFAEKPNEESNKNKSIPVVYCSSCNAKMSQTQTNFSVDTWNGQQLETPHVLPATICVCQSCGKIEFKTDKATPST